MFPDFLKLKKQLSEERSADLSVRHFGDAVLAKIRSYRQHEGDRFTIFRDDGSSTTKPQKQILSEPMNIDLRDVHTRGERAINESIAIATGQIAAQSRRLVATTLEEEPVPKVEAHGQRFSAEFYLKVLNAMELSFDETGKWVEPEEWQEHPNPRLMELVRKEKERFKEEPELRDQLNALLTTKKEEWDARQANRKLVD